MVDMHLFASGGPDVAPATDTIFSALAAVDIMQFAGLRLLYAGVGQWRRIEF